MADGTDIISLVSPRPQSRWRPWLLLFGFWTVIALFSALSMYLNALSEDEKRSLRQSLAYSLPEFWLWFVLTPVVVFLGNRTARAGWGRFALVHVPASLVLGVMHGAATLTLLYLTAGRPASPTWTLPHLLKVELIYQAHLAVLIYWAVLGVTRGADSHRRLRDERLRSTQLEQQLTQTQLQALRAQLQPHFLFNTLNAISALALSDPPLARVMISRLGDFLRLTLEDDQQQHVPLRRELEFLDCYLGIQRVRFGDRLVTDFAIDPDTLDACVPHLILQPLVENALQHGLLRLAEGGTLRVAARRDADNLHLTVEDNGQGLAPGAIREGVGLGNTRARLEALGGSALGLRKRADGGTCVEVSLPYRAASA